MGSQESGGETVDAASSGGQFEELVDELNLTPNIVPLHPPNLPLPDHIDGFVTLNRSLCRAEFSEALFGFHAAFDRTALLLEDIVQVLHGSVPTTAAKNSFLLDGGDGRP
jgi:hypothetical protein